MRYDSADAALIGLGDLGPEAPLRVDGFLTVAEVARLVAAGAVLAKIAVLAFVIVFIQKRPRGLFALKGRAVEA